jgi:hypothetical protein
MDSSEGMKITQVGLSDIWSSDTFHHSEETEDTSTARRISSTVAQSGDNKFHHRSLEGRDCTELFQVFFLFQVYSQVELSQNRQYCSVYSIHYMVISL